MTHDIMDFIEYIHNEKQTSKNTEVSYERDLRKMNEYLEAQNVYLSLIHISFGSTGKA